MSKDKAYSCSLSPETLKKAKDELNEDPSTRLMEVDVFRKRVTNIPGLSPRTDTKFLLGFLRGHCFDQELAFKLIKNYYQIRIDKAEIFADLKPSRVRHVLESKAIEILKHRDNQGRRVLVYRSNLWDPDRSTFYDNIKLWSIIAQRLMEEEETSVNGVRFVYSMGGLTMKQVTCVGPSQAEMLISLAFNCFPLHVKQCDFFFENRFFDVLYAVVKNFLNAELIQRIHFHGKNVGVLQETMDVNHIPTDLGGKEEVFSNQEWHDDILEMDKWYEETNKFGFVSMNVTNEKKERCQEHAGMAGLGGSFKKLDT